MFYYKGIHRPIGEDIFFSAPYDCSRRLWRSWSALLSVEEQRDAGSAHVDGSSQWLHKINFAEKADYIQDGEPGDAIFVLDEQPHPLIKRRGELLACNLVHTNIKTVQPSMPKGHRLWFPQATTCTRKGASRWSRRHVDSKWNLSFSDVPPLAVEYGQLHIPHTHRHRVTPPHATASQMVRRHEKFG